MDCKVHSRNVRLDFRNMPNVGYFNITFPLTVVSTAGAYIQLSDNKIICHRVKTADIGSATGAIVVFDDYILEKFKEYMVVGTIITEVIDE